MRELLALERNFILCTEFKRVLNYKAVGTIWAAQNHFHWSQWVADIPSILSMVLNRGKRENVIADKSVLNDVEDLDKTLARINNDGEYLGEFSFTVVLYGLCDQHKLQKAASDVIKIFGNQEAALIHETYNALNAYLAIIPGNNAFNLRRTWLLSGNYADLSFLYSRAVGEKTTRYLRNEYLVVLERNDRTPYDLCGHDDERFGLLIFGAPRTYRVPVLINRQEITGEDRNRKLVSRRRFRAVCARKRSARARSKDIRFCHRRRFGTEPDHGKESGRVAVTDDPARVKA